MKTQGTKIAFEPRAPTREELQDCPYIQMKSKKILHDRENRPLVTSNTELIANLV